jgi:hypothetical protein
MLDFLMLINRQGKVRTVRWYHQDLSMSHRHRIMSDLPSHLLDHARRHRTTSTSNMLEWAAPHRRTPTTLAYRRYASLFFAAALAPDANPLLVLELIHRLVETLDRYFRAVCELDLVFAFHKTAYVIDEMWVGGRVGEACFKRVLEVCLEADEQERIEKEEATRAVAPRLF